MSCARWERKKRPLLSARWMRCRRALLKRRRRCSPSALQQLAKGEGSEAAEAARMLMGFRYAVAHLDEDYAVLLEGRGRERTLTVYCLLPGREIARVTRGSARFGFFSATLTPLSAMKRLLGGEEADACFALPLTV